MAETEQSTIEALLILDFKVTEKLKCITSTFGESFFKHHMCSNSYRNACINMYCSTLGYQEMVYLLCQRQTSGYQARKRGLMLDSVLLDRGE